MKRLVTNRELVNKWNGEFGIRIRKKIHESIKESGECELTQNGDSGFEVVNKGDTYVIIFEGRTCPCRRWDLTRISWPMLFVQLNILNMTLLHMSITVTVSLHIWKLMGI